MTDTIVQEVRDARAAIAAEFNYDLGKYLDWIRQQTAAQRSVPPPFRPDKAVELPPAGGEAALDVVAAARPAVEET